MVLKVTWDDDLPLTFCLHQYKGASGCSSLGRMWTEVGKRVSFVSALMNIFEGGGKGAAFVTKFVMEGFHCSCRLPLFGKCF